MRTQFDALLRDMRAGFLAIRSAPLFSAIVILTVALGVGANTTVFSVVYAVLLQPPPYPNPDRLTEIWETTSGQRLPVSWLNFRHWQDENHTFRKMAGCETADLTFTGHGAASLIHAGVVTSSFLHLTGWAPLAGRLLITEDDSPDAAPVVIVSREFWAKKLNGDPHAIGSALALDGTAYQIVGILPEGLRFFTQPVDVYVSAGRRLGNTLNRAEHGAMAVIALLKPDITRETAQADLDGIMSRLAIAASGPEDGHHSSVLWLAGFGTEEIQPVLFTLMAAVGVVLIISCANVAGLFLMRSTTRLREIAIRSALGATRPRLARQLFTENLILVALGGTVGWQFASICLRSLLLLAPRDIPRLWASSLNLPLLWFTTALTAVTALLAGFAPAFELGALDIPRALKEGSPGAGSSKRGESLRSCLIVMEIALTLVLAFGGALLVRSLIAARSVHPGFSADRVLAVELLLPPSRYGNPSAASGFQARLLKQLRYLPGVESAGAIDCPPSTGGCARGWYSIPEMPVPRPEEVPLTLLTRVDPEYFRTLQIPLFAGRGFNSADRDDMAVLVNEKLARHWWPGAPQLAVGHRIKFGGPYMEGPTREIVGVVGDVSQAALDVEAFSEIYVKGAQKKMVIMVRVAADPVSLIPPVRHELTTLDPNVPVISLMPLSVRMAATLERRHFITLLLGIFAALAATLTSVGILGILNYYVNTRQKDIAIRLALGATRSEILKWVGSRLLRVAVPGIVVGALGCWGISRLLSSMVFGISAGDKTTLLASLLSR